MDQMKATARDGAHAANIARVLRDLRLKQHHVKHLRWLENLIRWTASRFPLEEPRRTGPRRNQAMSNSAPKSGEKIVMLVDDEFSYIDLLQQLLGEHLDRPVHGFTKPADALRALPSLNVIRRGGAKGESAGPHRDDHRLQYELYGT
jgi:hypothetical protein